jgi:hypothetical protein
MAKFNTMRASGAALMLALEADTEGAHGSSKFLFRLGQKQRQGL